MKHFSWTSYSFLFAVCLHATVAFKIPGFSSGGGNRTPPPGKGPSGVGNHNNNNNNKGTDGEYMGPVFIIRELGKENGEYDAFITTGGIQEVKPPASASASVTSGGGSYGAQQNNKPAKESDEDSEYFGVLVTPETVKQLNYHRSTAINVSLSVLLTAASSRMPWLLVLRRVNYPQLFDYQQQQQQPPAAQAVHSAGVPGIAGIPGLQVPQRRRYYSSSSDRQRRGLYSDGYEHYTRAVPLVLERELLSTMCYNFVRDYASKGPKLPIVLARPEQDAAAAADAAEESADFVGQPQREDSVFFDADAYAAAATRFQPSPPPPPPTTAQPEQDDRGLNDSVKMTIPKRVS